MPGAVTLTLAFLSWMLLLLARREGLMDKRSEYQASISSLSPAPLALIFPGFFSRDFQGFLVFFFYLRSLASF